MRVAIAAKAGAGRIGVSCRIFRNDNGIVRRSIIPGIEAATIVKAIPAPWVVAVPITKSEAVH